MKGVGIPLRQIAIRNIGHELPTLLITNDLTSAAKDLFGRYVERMIIENELDADLSRCQPNALASGLTLNLELDTTFAGNAYGEHERYGLIPGWGRISHPRSAECQIHTPSSAKSDSTTESDCQLSGGSRWISISVARRQARCTIP